MIFKSEYYYQHEQKENCDCVFVELEGEPYRLVDLESGNIYETANDKMATSAFKHLIRKECSRLKYYCGNLVKDMPTKLAFHHLDEENTIRTIFSFLRVKE